MELDLKNLTLDGHPVQWDDVVIFAAAFASKNPEHKEAQDLVAWLHGYHGTT